MAWKDPGLMATSSSHTNGHVIKCETNKGELSRFQFRHFGNERTAPIERIVRQCITRDLGSHAEDGMGSGYSKRINITYGLSVQKVCQCN